MQAQNTEQLKWLILNSNEPFVIKKKLNWGLLTWSLEDWGRLLKKEKLIFRCGTKSFTKQPQWERTTAAKEATFEDFLSFTRSESESWMYFDYKYLREWFNNIQELKDNIKWGKFGFPELSSEESTIWIGSAGAHTPCHVDTYGCNLVAQIFGRKQWILCPPDEDLKPSRVPYEESSVYSKLNFFSPNIEDFKGIKHCRKIILEPGDVLFVPHKWWHYVENLDTAISINVWLPLPVDDEERLKESLVQLFITQITQNVGKEIKEVILNPNSDKGMEGMTLETSVDLVGQCRNIIKSKQNKQRDAEAEESQVKQYFNKCSFIDTVPNLSAEEFLHFLELQRCRFNNVNVAESCDFEELINVVNAFTHSDAILLIKNKLFE